MLERRIVPGVRLADLSADRVGREFRRLLRDGARLRPAGSARRSPRRLLSEGYTPKQRVDLFDARFYLTHLRADLNFRFFVAYVMLPGGVRNGRAPEIHPRIFYKDSSLVWRAASHYIRSEGENWIGKGDIRSEVVDGEVVEYSAEETTNLPLELQTALDAASRGGGRVRVDRRAMGRVLRRAPDGRLEPYRDFSEPRRRARADRRNRVHGGAEIARFERPDDPASLVFAAGYEPDFADGVLESSRLRSRLYGGRVRKFRILSENRKIQYQFVAAPRQVWIVPPQALTTQLNSYGVRTIDVAAPEDLCVPGFEYHYLDETVWPPRHHSQIPEGFAGSASPVDPSRADASPWIEKLPVVREFRRRLV